MKLLLRQTQIKLMVMSLMVPMLLLPALNSFASHKIKVMALFTDKAMIVVDGSQKILKKGQTYKGVKLISSDSNAVVLELHGECNHAI
ncbi:MAG: hypothetical protein KZQ64_06340 [gamma proteobacterium symbiont of Bathyaustriella thionipta]|nr:hypothetical protein [gamma proteobacterium symbiont of Bathyaustriella thionipta]MCU7950179.1 hypothetical protein [gamma proteobacterium symbiont of Bathyaustriella thionipta]MCU7952991.1 hypothetical protein [gamma proteobacterium symbiont of Bathyaustriella thionipta]MCU7956721.1 hypothetical protein [gamma proteobacterium symbiont of Bathyaustriella thionipta]MCU7966369.1 hypothetical protein [gamma proteobacterium symbiont of Bathyaustriella thionipta]